MHSCSDIQTLTSTITFTCTNNHIHAYTHTCTHNHNHIHSYLHTLHTHRRSSQYMLVKRRRNASTTLSVCCTRRQRSFQTNRSVSQPNWCLGVRALHSSQPLWSVTTQYIWGTCVYLLQVLQRVCNVAVLPAVVLFAS
jgi:hypothetical protein